MRMRLKKIIIQNFKGCKDRIIDFGNRTAIKGINGSGKTTIADAVMWVLFGKDSSGASTFDIRPKNSQNNDVDFVDIRVESVWDVDGRELTLVKTQKQKWVKKRGSEEQTFQGNENLYEINTIPKSEKEFKAYIEQLVSEEVFKFVSNTNAFMAQKPADRRKTLFNLVSDMTDADVLATDPKFQPLTDQLSQFTSEEILSRDKKALLENKRKLEEIPTRIDEVSKSIVEQDYSGAEAKLQELRAQLESVEEDKSDTFVHESLNEFKAKKARFEGDLQELERKINAENNRKRSELQSSIIEIDQQLQRAGRDKNGAEKEARFCEADIEKDKKALARLSEEYKAERAVEMPEGSNICPTCHREYSDDVKESISSRFQAEKEQNLLSISTKGRRAAEAVKEDEARLKGWIDKAAIYDQEICKLTEDRNALQERLESLPRNIDPRDTEEYQIILMQIATLESQIEEYNNLVHDVNAKKAVTADKKRAIQSEIDVMNRILAGRQTIANAKARVEELKAGQRQLSQDIASTEREIYLLEEFNKAKVNLLSDKINARFKIVRWKLFERQINGGYNQVCEPLINGQAYSSALNSGHKILAELDIIQALQRIYDVSVPVFLDNAERINDFNIPHMNCQLITLSVTEDPELKVVND